MRVLVVFESMFGNTRDVADAVADGIRTVARVEVLEVDDAPVRLGSDVGLIVVGAPTHAFGLSRPGTRADARRQTDGAVSAGAGVREWLDRLQSVHGAIAAAAFDTRISRPGLAGSAARAARRRLRRLGFRLIAPAERIYVDDTSGPLRAGEIDRAQVWGTRLGRRAVTGASGPDASATSSAGTR